MKAKRRKAQYQDDPSRGKKREKAASRREQKPLPRLPKIANLAEEGFGSWAKSVLAFLGVWFANLGRRYVRFWFSKRGIILSLKIWGTIIIVFTLFVGGLFLYFSKDLYLISPSELDRKVISTTNRYLDRNGELLWEDRGDGDYRIAVDGSEISQYARWSAVAIEDRNFYTHHGVSLRDTARALWMTLTGSSVQGGSTLTQQLVKQVFFADEAHDRGLSGVPRKVKEAILAIEVERNFSKEEIITMYLNQSPFGGRRNGIESGARAYFGKSAKDLTLAEAALLTAIPQNPTQLTPFCYNNESAENCAKRRSNLLSRQRYTLVVMADIGFITHEQAQEAIDFDIIATIRPNDTQFSDMLAPHFVMEVRRQLEDEFGVAAVRAGGWTVTTTLDLRAQRVADEATEANLQSLMNTSANNMAMVSVDVETGQVIALVGSAGMHLPGYGELNAATALLEPASTIKTFVYAELFQQRAGRNFGPGSIIRDEDINEWYCAGTTGRCNIGNTTPRTGDLTIRYSLGTSLNRPVVKAMAIAGVDETISTIQRLGNHSYCAGRFAGLSTAFGNGCNIRLTEHANAYASLARGGVYKPLSYVIRAVDGNGRVVKQWHDVSGERVIDPQAAYMALDVINDPSARTSLGAGMTGSSSLGWIVPGVWTASKTGTGTGATGARKDNLFTSTSPVVATTIWCGRHDGTDIPRACGTQIRRIIGETMEGIHRDVYIPDGRYTRNQPLARPSGIHNLTIAGISDIASSWTNRSNTGWEEMEMDFDAATRTRATHCTWPQNRVAYRVLGLVDAMSGTISIVNGPGGFDPAPINEDDVVCGPQPPVDSDDGPGPGED